MQLIIEMLLKLCSNRIIHDKRTGYLLFDLNYVEKKKFSQFGNIFHFGYFKYLKILLLCCKLYPLSVVHVTQIQSFIYKINPFVTFSYCWRYCSQTSCVINLLIMYHVLTRFWTVILFTKIICRRTTISRVSIHNSD